MTETSFSLTVNGMPVGDATTINLQPGQDLHMALALEISLDLVGIPVAAVGGGEEPAPEGVYDAILPALGQSNNVGQSNAEEGDVFPAGVDEIRLASETGGVVEVLVPSIQSLEGLSTPGWSYSGNDAVYNNRTGWWYKWVIDYLADHPGARVLIIPIGLGGVGFKDYQDSLNTWNPWSPLVQPNFKNAEGEGQQLVSFAQQMLAMGMALAKPDAEVHIGWWQGEADVNSGMTQAEYASYLTYFVNLLRAVPGANKATFTTFGIFGPATTDPTFETINAALQDAVAALPLAQFIDTAALAGSLLDSVHADRTKQHASGAADYAGLATLTDGSSAPTAFGPGDWSVGPLDGNTEVRIKTLPATGGLPTVIQYKVGSGEWTDLPSTMIVPATTGQSVYLRHVNENGASASSAAKTVTASPPAWWLPNAVVHLDLANDRAYVDGVAYDSVAAAVTAGALTVRTAGADPTRTSYDVDWSAGTGALSEWTCMVRSQNGPSSPDPEWVYSLGSSTLSNDVASLTVSANTAQNPDMQFAWATDGYGGTELKMTRIGNIVPNNNLAHIAVRGVSGEIAAAALGRYRELPLSVQRPSPPPAVDIAVVGDRFAGNRKFEGQIFEWAICASAESVNWMQAVSAQLPELTNGNSLPKYLRVASA